MDPATPKPLTERQLVRLAVDTIRSCLPATWSLEEEAAKRSVAVDLSATLRAPDGRSKRLLIEAKTLLNTRDVPLLAQQVLSVEPAAVDVARVVAARYLSPRAREALVAAGISYVDATGNASIKIDDPAVFVETSGSNSDPWRTPDRPTNSLRGRPAARVVRALADMPPPWKVRELALAAGTSLGSTARTLDFLDREALLQRDASGMVASVDWEALIERWARDHDVARYRRVVRLIEPRGVERVERALPKAGPDYVISGSVAARRRAEYAEAKMALVYTDEPDRLVQELGLRESDVGSNVLIVEPPDDLPFVRSWSEAGTRYAALAQVAVDLLSGPGRNPEEGKALLRWMRRSEVQWRTRQ